MADKPNDLEQRIANLERANRRLRTAVLVIPVVVLPLLILGAVSDSQSVPGPVSATSFTLVGENGQRLAALGKTTDDRPTFNIYNGNKHWNVLVQRKDGSVSISAEDFYVWDKTRKIGASFGLSNSGRAGMWTNDHDKQRNVFLHSSTEKISFRADDFWVENAQGSTLAAIGTSNEGYGGVWLSVGGKLKSLATGGGKSDWFSGTAIIIKGIK